VLLLLFARSSAATDKITMARNPTRQVRERMQALEQLPKRSKQISKEKEEAADSTLKVCKSPEPFANNIFSRRSC